MQMPNLHWFQLFKYENKLLFIFFDNKLHVFVVWTIGWTKKDIWRHLGNFIIKMMNRLIEEMQKKIVL